MYSTTDRNDHLNEMKNKHKNTNRFYASHSKKTYRILASATICNCQYSLSVQAVYNGKTVNVIFVNHCIWLINCKKQLFNVSEIVSGLHARLHHEEKK